MKNLKDEELVSLCKEGSQEAVEVLFERYRPHLKRITRGYFLLGSDNDDLMQEALIGLYKAVVSFKQNQQASFKTFAILCVRRNILDAIKKSNAQKHKVLNDSVSLSNYYSSSDDEDESVLFMPYISSNDDHQKIEEKEAYQEIMLQIKQRLSNLEYDILTEYLKGYSYQYIAEKLSINTKSVDNALSRIKSKLQFLLE